MSKEKKTNKPMLGTPKKLGTPKSKVNVAKLKNGHNKEERKATTKLGKSKKVSMKNTGSRKAKIVAMGPTGRPRALSYELPKPKEATPEKMNAQLVRLHERKLVSSKVKSLIGTVIVKRHRGLKWVVKGTKKGWLIKRGDKQLVGKTFTQLYGVACNMVDGPRDPYLFFRDELKHLKPRAAA